MTDQTQDLPEPQEPEEADAERLREDQLDEAAAQQGDTQSQGRPSGDSEPGDEPGGDDAPDGGGHASGQQYSGTES